MSKPTPTPYGEFSAIGCRFEDNEGYVSYGDSSGTEITALPWPEAVKVFAIWWKDRRLEIKERLEQGAAEAQRRASKASAGRTLH